MYQLEWAQSPSRHASEGPGVLHPSRVDEKAIARVFLTVWAEHCVEDAPQPATR